MADHKFNGLLTEKSCAADGRFDRTHGHERDGHQRAVGLADQLAFQLHRRAVQRKVGIARRLPDVRFGVKPKPLARCDAGRASFVSTSLSADIR